MEYSENQQNQFGQPGVNPNGPYAVQDPVPNATAVLVLGIISIVGCFCYGIVGLVCGIIALILASSANKLIVQDPLRFSKSSIANLKAGRVCAIIGVILSSIYIVGVILYIMAIFSILSPAFLDAFQGFKY